MERWERVKRLVDEALTLDGSQRVRFLEDNCAGDPSLRAEVESLLGYEQDDLLGSAGLAASGSEPGTEADSSRPARPEEPEGPSGVERAQASRRHPLRRVAWALAGLLLLQLGAASHELLRTGATRPSFGWTERPDGDGWRVDEVSAAGPADAALQPGDRIVALDAVPPIGLMGTRYQRRELRSGDRYVLVVQRGGELRELDLVVASIEASLAPGLTYLLLGLVWGGVGLLVGFARPDHPVARLSCLAALATGQVFLDVGIVQRILNVAPLHGVLGFHFFSRFPSGRELRPAWRIPLLLLYAMGGVRVVVAGVVSTTALVFGPAEAARFAFLLGSVTVYTLPAWAFLGALVGIFAVIPYNYRRLTDPDQRRRVRWMVYGSSVALLPNFWWMAMALVNEGEVGWRLSLFTNASSIAVPICMAYVVLQHRVLGIRVALRRGLQYLLARRALQAGVALPLAALARALVVHRHRTVAELTTENGWFVAWLVVSGVVLRFRQPIRLWIDRRFFAEQYDRELLLMGLLQDVGRLDSISDLARLVTARLDAALHPKTIYLWYRDPGERASAASTDPALTPPDLPAGGRWLAWLERRASAVSFPVPDEAEMSREELRWFAEHEVQLAVPILDGGEHLVGALLLGEKASEEPYSPSDQRLLEAIARQTAVVRENLRLRARVSEDARIRHDVLARLDGRLPGLLKECPACGRCFDGDALSCEDDGEALSLSLPVSRVVDGKYRLDRLIGKGGMGAVYEARDLRLARPVAVKCLLGRQFGQPSALRRFRREARAAARLNHRNVVAVYDYGSLEGEGAYLVMELVRGSTLRAELQRSGTLSGAEAARWFEPLLDGVAAAHAQSMVHRDLKPENVIAARGDTLEVRILDLGLVKLGPDESISADPLTAAGAVMGTFAYMAPEQLHGREVDHRADIFSVALMLIETLTGRHPFRDGDALRSRAMRLGGCRVSGRAPEAAALAALLSHCLVVEPEARFGSAAALKLQLGPLLRSGAPLQLEVEPYQPLRD